MVGFTKIAKKELIDCVSNQTFLICYLILLIATTINAFEASKSFNEHVFHTLSYESNIKNAIFLQLPTLFHGVILTISEYGGILAFVLSSAYFIDERKSGSLKVTLSYPLHRDSILIGKLIAGVTILGLCVFSSLLIGLGIEIYLTGIVIDVIWMKIFFVFYIVSVVYLGIFLFLGSLFSLMFKDSSESLLAGLIIVLLLSTSFWEYSGSAIGQMIYGSPFTIVEFEGEKHYVVNYKGGYGSFIDNFNKINPTNTYQQIFTNVCFFFLNKHNEIITFWSALLYVSDRITILFVFLCGLFILNYLIFRRMEIA